MTKKVLMLEDDTALCAIVQEFLSLHHYDVHLCHRGAQFIDQLEQGPYDLILLDLNLPDADGLDVLKTLRAKDNTLLYVLSGRTDQNSRIQALMLGADDFIAKPFSIRELELKIRNAFARRGPGPEQAALSTDQALKPLGKGLFLNSHTRCLTSETNETLPLTRGEFELLTLMIKANGQIVTREILISQLSASAIISSHESITTLVYRLRQKCKQLGFDCPILTIAREGYRLQA